MKKSKYKELPYHANATPQRIVNAVTDAGGLPMVLPLSDSENAEMYVNKVDAIILTGGSDVNPLLFGEEPSLKIQNIEPHRDEFELEIIKAAREQNKPILGICRGMQLLNVAFGGTIYQDLSYYDGLELKHVQVSPYDDKTHSVKFEASSFLSNIFGTDNAINSLHHQSIKDLAEIFRPVGWAPDGVIEAIENNDDGSKIVGVQWHPEELITIDSQSQELFDEFVKLAQ